MAQCYKSLLTSNMLTTRPWKYLFYSPVLNLSPDRKLIPKFVRRMRPLAFTCAENVRSPSRRSWHATTTLCRFFQNLRFIDVLWKNGTQRTKYIFSFSLASAIKSKYEDFRHASVEGPLENIKIYITKPDVTRIPGRTRLVWTLGVLIALSIGRLLPSE